VAPNKKCRGFCLKRDYFEPKKMVFQPKMAKTELGKQLCCEFFFKCIFSQKCQFLGLNEDIKWSKIAQI
jgi:hypothetical protein